jgi:glycerate 2-kinase
MIIRNFKSLSTNREKQNALSIIEAGLEASLPGKQLEKIIRYDHLFMFGKKFCLKKYDNVFIIAMGKAAYSMAESVNSLTSITRGLLVVPKKTKTTLTRNFKVMQAGHPLPNKNSVVAAKKILEFLEDVKPHDFVIFLISGGASSLVALPDGITLEEKKIVTDLMLKCGATIHEINCIRKHLSKIKGGRLLGRLRSEGISLVMSDVVGDDLTSIASGITYYDKTTFSDAGKILKKYNLGRSFPKSILRHIDLGMKRKIPETPKRQKIKNQIISTNKICLDAMNIRAKDLGFSTKVLNCMSGDVKDLGMKIAKTLSDKKINCVIFGGEGTVVVKGKGKGGRNQELVLYTAIDLAKQGKKAIVASVGTDGVDGNTDCAGAIWKSDRKIDKITPYLNENNSYNFFRKYGGLVFTGPTGTNLMDIGLVLRQ